MLKVRAIVEMRQEFSLAIFAPPDSPLLEVADFPCPIRSLDLSAPEFDRAVQLVVDRGVKLRGILALRDGNVYAAAAACHKRGWPSPPLDVLDHVRRKSAFRSWTNKNSKVIGCRSIQWRPIPKGVTYAKFRQIIGTLYHSIPGACAGIIIKPDAGSCSQLIVRIDSIDSANLKRAWRVVHRGQTFRNGCFLAEEAIDGREIAIDTVSTSKITRTYVTAYLSRDQGKFYTSGAVVPAHPPLENSVEHSVRTLVAKVHAELGLVSMVTHMEVILPDDGSVPFIVELNPRMGGGALQEMHRLVTGVQMCQIAGRLALGKTNIAELLGNSKASSGLASQVLIKFRRPGTGTMKLGKGESLRRPFERFRLLKPVDSELVGGDSDDDLLAWCLIGATRGEFASPEDSFQSLLRRAEALMRKWLPDAR